MGLHMTSTHTNSMVGRRRNEWIKGRHVWPIDRSNTISRAGQEVLNYWRGETYKQVQPSECQLEPQLSVNNPVDKPIELPVHSPFGMQRSQINPNHAHTDRSPP